MRETQRKLCRPVCAALLALAGVGPALADQAADRFDTVVVDAGHGGEDHGAKGSRGTLEKDVVLRVARDLASALRGAGLRVVMTRDADHFVSLERRTHIANDADGDLFVSIHANAASDRSARGIETFFLSLDASDESSRRVAERENRAFGREALGRLSVDPVAAILNGLLVDEYLRESQEFAGLAQGRFAALDPHASRGVKQAPFVVLSDVQMPAALVEIGFITNPEEEGALAAQGGRKRIVGALVRAVREFGRRYDARRGVAVPPARGSR